MLCWGLFLLACLPVLGEAVRMHLLKNPAEKIFGKNAKNC